MTLKCSDARSGTAVTCSSAFSPFLGSSLGRSNPESARRTNARRPHSEAEPSPIRARLAARFGGTSLFCFIQSSLSFATPRPAARAETAIGTRCRHLLPRVFSHGELLPGVVVSSFPCRYTFSSPRPLVADIRPRTPASCLISMSHLLRVATIIRTAALGGNSSPSRYRCAYTGSFRTARALLGPPLMGWLDSAACRAPIDSTARALPCKSPTLLTLPLPS